MSLSNFGRLTALGKGSYGRVYRARRHSDGQYYAIKEMDISHMNQKEREDAVNEVRILASVEHSNVIRYCEAFVENNQMYIVTELADCDLDSRMAQKKRIGSYFNEKTIWRYFIQMCLGLRALHQQDIIHRDLKPQNIFLTSDQRIKIGDLGCSKLMKGYLCKTQCGTPYYMSPELWQNRPYNKQSDIWSLGCVLYQLMTFNPPFDARDLRSLAHKVAHGPTPHIRTGSKYSPELTKLVNRMLHKDPRKRPTVAKILSLSCIKKRFSLVHADCMESAFRLCPTIKVPHNIHRLNLPDAAYDRLKEIRQIQSARMAPPSAKIARTPTPINPAQALSDPTDTKRPRGGGLLPALNLKPLINQRQQPRQQKSNANGNGGGKNMYRIHRPISSRPTPGGPQYYQRAPISARVPTRRERMRQHLQQANRGRNGMYAPYPSQQNNNDIHRLYQKNHHQQHQQTPLLRPLQHIPSYHNQRHQKHLQQARHNPAPTPTPRNLLEKGYQEYRAGHANEVKMNKMRGFLHAEISPSKAKARAARIRSSDMNHNHHDNQIQVSMPGSKLFPDIKLIN